MFNILYEAIETYRTNKAQEEKRSLENIATLVLNSIKQGDFKVAPGDIIPTEYPAHHEFNALHCKCLIIYVKLPDNYCQSIPVDAIINKLYQVFIGCDISDIAISEYSATQLNIILQLPKDNIIFQKEDKENGNS